jgi:hypothetical protein
MLVFVGSYSESIAISERKASYGFMFNYLARRRHYTDNAEFHLEDNEHVDASARYSRSNSLKERGLFRSLSCHCRSSIQRLGLGRALRLSKAMGSM